MLLKLLLLFCALSPRDCQVVQGPGEHTHQKRLYAKDCSCAGFKPCQYVFGDNTCYSLVQHPGGSQTCPAQTIHCRCPCLNPEAPCQNVKQVVLAEETKARQCLDTVYMFGQAVCPAGTVHCRISSPPAAANGQVTEQIDDACPCTLARPCRDLSKAVNQAGGDCTAARPDTLSCPAGMSRCFVQSITPECVCGGGRPCLWRGISRPDGVGADACHDGIERVQGSAQRLYP